MKKKYTLTVADSQISVITEEPKEAIDTIVGVVDRRIREIHLHSKSCSRVDAALLLSLDYCAENIQMKKKLKQANAEIERLAVLNESIARENASLEREIETLRKSLSMSTAPKSHAPSSSVQLGFDDISSETNETIAIIAEQAHEDAKGNGDSKGEKDSSVDKILEAETTTNAETVSVSSDTDADDDEKDGKGKKKKKVRSMFDLISFDDI